MDALLLGFLVKLTVGLRVEALLAEDYATQQVQLAHLAVAQAGAPLGVIVVFTKVVLAEIDVSGVGDDQLGVHDAPHGFSVFINDDAIINVFCSHDDLDEVHDAPNAHFVPNLHDFLREINDV